MKKTLIHALMSTLVLASLLVTTVATPAHAGGIVGGWVKSTILEQFGVTATEAYDSISFYQIDNYSVGSPTENGDGYCYNSSFPGWSRKACYYNLEDYSPDTSGIDVHAGWTNSFCSCDYQQYGVFQGYWDNTYDFWCGLDYGALPYLWSQNCDGSEY